MSARYENDEIIHFTKRGEFNEKYKCATKQQIFDTIEELNSILYTFIPMIREKVKYLVIIAKEQ